MGVVDPAVGQQRRALHPRQVAEVENQRVLAGVPVNAQALEAVVPVVVDMLELPEDVVAAVVAGGGGRTQPGQGAGLELRVRRRRQEPLVRVHLEPGGMVDGDQRGGVEVDDLLELVGRLQDVAAFLGHQLPDAHVLVVVGGVVLPRRREVADDTSPEEVGHEAEAVAVPGVEDGAGGPLAVQLHEVEPLPRRRRQLGLPDPARPQDANELDRVRRAQAEGEARRGAAAPAQLPFLLVAAGLDLHLGAETVEVAVQTAEADADPAAARGGVGVQLPVGPDVDVAVAVEVLEQDQPGGPCGAQSRIGRTEAAAGALQEADSALSEGNEVEVAVVVDVGGADAAGLFQGNFPRLLALETGSAPPVFKEVDFASGRDGGDIDAPVRGQVADAEVCGVAAAAGKPSETALGGAVREGAVAVVLVELDPAAVEEDEEVDVAVVVEVGEDRLPPGAVPYPGGPRDVFEGGAAVVAQQAHAPGPRLQQVEIAVVVDVGRHRPRESAAERDRLPEAAIVVEGSETRSGADRHVGVAVAVEIAEGKVCGILHRYREAPAVVGVQPLAVAGQQAETGRLGDHHAGHVPASDPRDRRGRQRRVSRRGLLAELEGDRRGRGLSRFAGVAAVGEGLGVLPLALVGRADSLVSGAAEPVEFLERQAPLLRALLQPELMGEGVVGGDAVRVELDGPLELRDRLVAALQLREGAAEVVVHEGIVVVGCGNRLEGRQGGLVLLALGVEDQPARVVGVQQTGVAGQGFVQGHQGGVVLAQAEQGDPEVGACQRVRGIRRRGGVELLAAAHVVVLVHVDDALVVVPARLQALGGWSTWLAGQPGEGR